MSGDDTVPVVLAKQELEKQIVTLVKLFQQKYSVKVENIRFHLSQHFGQLIDVPEVYVDIKP